MRLIGAMLATGLACASAHASDKNDNFQVLGAGTVTCQQYLGTSAQNKTYAETWWAGYASAMNRTTGETWSLLGDTPVDGVNAMIEAECKAHPTEMFGLAVHDVLEQLYPKRKQTSPN